MMRLVDVLYSIPFLFFVILLVVVAALVDPRWVVEVEAEAQLD